MTTAATQAARKERIHLSTASASSGRLLPDGRIVSRGPAGPIDPLSEDFERLGFDLDEGAAERADPCVEIRRPGLLEIGKKVSHPGYHMVFEHLTLGSRGRRDPAAGEGRHDFHKHRGVILRF